jgi:glutamate-1-semialdehyde 2,1-aminomutase
LACLAELDRAAYERLEDIAARLARGLEDAIAGEGVAVQVPRVGPLVGLFFDERPVRNFDDARVAAENGCYKVFFHAMLRQGVALAPGPYEAIFPSLAHSDDDLQVTFGAAVLAAREVAAATRG